MKASATGGERLGHKDPWILPVGLCEISHLSVAAPCTSTETLMTLNEHLSYFSFFLRAVPQHHKFCTSLSVVLMAGSGHLRRSKGGDLSANGADVRPRAPL